MKALLRPYWGLRTWKRHDLILSVAGAMYVMIGIAYVINKPNIGQSSSLQILLRVAPIEFWGGVFIFTGILSIISSKWPPFAETWGYAVLTGFTLGWASTYLIGILLAKAPWTNINGFLIWGVLAFIWWAVSGLVNPETVVRDADRSP